MMAKDSTNNSDDFLSQLDQIKKGRESKRIDHSKNFEVDNETVNHVSKILDSVIKDFRTADRSLFLQSRDSTTFFLSYGFVHVCRIWISSASPKSVEILMQSDSISQVYSGGLQQEDIEKSVKNALLQWYSNF